MTHSRDNLRRKRKARRKMDAGLWRAPAATRLERKRQRARLRPRMRGLGNVVRERILRAYGSPLMRVRWESGAELDCWMGDVEADVVRGGNGDVCTLYNQAGAGGHLHAPMGHEPRMQMGTFGPGADFSGFKATRADGDQWLAYSSFRSVRRWQR